MSWHRGISRYEKKPSAVVLFICKVFVWQVKSSTGIRFVFVKQELQSSTYIIYATAPIFYIRLFVFITNRRESDHRHHRRNTVTFLNICWTGAKRCAHYGVVFGDGSCQLSDMEVSEWPFSDESGPSNVLCNLRYLQESGTYYDGDDELCFAVNAKISSATYWFTYRVRPRSRAVGTGLEFWSATAIFC